MLLTLNFIKLLSKAKAKLVFRRYFCSQTNQILSGNAENGERPVRVRFAPSPTGYLHLGGLRTALYNYLYTKANSGTFIVRIEDTDQSRTIAGAQESLFECLEWAGITPDESVYHGGNHGPYVQSQRLDIYQKQVQQLIDNGHAYYCFCTERRLELLRRDALRANDIPKYDNRCRHLTPEKVAEKLASNDPKVIRFKLESKGDFVFDDMVFGEKIFKLASEADPIIIKADGFPTYHFANVVDDHFMKISHVLRGVEWQISTPKHLLMYQAFGWTPPKFAHLPLILNTDGSKLSKRHDHANVNHYRALEIFPQALVNYITLNGGGFKERGSYDKSENMDDLIKSFDIKEINTSPSRLQPALLDKCNRLEIQRQIIDPVLCEKLILQVRELIKKTFPNEIAFLDLDDNHVKNALNFASNNLNHLKELVDGDPSFLWVLPQIKNEYVQPNWIPKLCMELENIEFNKDVLMTELRAFAKKNKVNFGQMMQTMRMLLSYKKDGYQIAEMMEILGRNGTLNRLMRTPAVECNEKREKSC